MLLDGFFKLDGIEQMYYGCGNGDKRRHSLFQAQTRPGQADLDDIADSRTQLMREGVVMPL